MLIIWSRLTFLIIPKRYSKLIIPSLINNPFDLVLIIPSSLENPLSSGFQIGQPWNLSLHLRLSFPTVCSLWMYPGINQRFHSAFANASQQAKHNIVKIKRLNAGAELIQVSFQTVHLLYKLSFFPHIILSDKPSCLVCFSFRFPIETMQSLVFLVHISSKCKILCNFVPSFSNLTVGVTCLKHTWNKRILLV